MQKQSVSFQPKPLSRSSSSYSLLFDQHVNIDMKYVDYDRNIKQLGTLQTINFKIYTMNYKPNITSVKIIIDSDSDPFFSTVFQTDQTIFSIIKEQQKLNFDFQQFTTILIKTLNKIQENKGNINATLLIYSDGKCKFTISHTSEYKNIQIITLEFTQQTETQIESKVALKYQQLKNKVNKTQERLAKINQIIKQKNPSLLMQLTKKTFTSDTQKIVQ